MNLNTEIASLSQLANSNDLLQRLSAPTNWLGEEIIGLLPSTTLVVDGLRLVRVVLVTENYLCDVRTDVPLEVSIFDIVNRKSARNFRFQFWRQVIGEGESGVTYDLAKVMILHDLGPNNFATELVYAGHQREEWLARVKEILPLSLLTS